MSAMPIDSRELERTNEKSSLWERKKTTIIIVVVVALAFLLYKKKNK